ncbi:MAG: pyruvate formate lyase-activating protein [Zetaproteobacteria bacterium]|nr:pyruvate formate lyase-activating protein [Zetaproteobacteria bacterium]
MAWTALVAHDGGIAPVTLDQEGHLAGFVHSFEMGSAVDGPGMRFVVFVSGCQFRCLYCHNPDSVKMHNGTLMNAAGVMQEIIPYVPFLQGAGGLTITGGEPMVQAHFVRELFYLAKHTYQLHTTLDTQGFLAAHLEDAWFDDIDLVMLDIKHIDPQKYLALTSQPLQPTLIFAKRLAAMRKKIWIRYVLVPGYTDDYDDVETLADFVVTLSGVERVEVLPFHKMGEGKWQQLGYPYQLTDVPPPSVALLSRVVGQLKARGLNVC